ncbi:18169_t:CDS:1, partial [Funneliformis geosporum]
LEFKNNQLRYELTTAPSRTDIDEFLTQDVAKQILKRYLSGTNIDKLRKCGTMDKLVILIKEVFKIYYDKYDIQAVKKLDRIAINCKVASRSGKNIASRLML